MKTQQGNSMRRAVLIVAAIGMIISFIYLFVDLSYPVGNLKKHGPGLYPLFVSAVLMLGFLGSGVEVLISRSHKSA